MGDLLFGGDGEFALFGWWVDLYGDGGCCLVAESSFFVPVEDGCAAFSEVFDELLFLLVGGGFDVEFEFCE